MVISIHTAVVPTDDNSLEQNNVKENANNFLREQYYYSDGNNITPPANTAVVTATNSINNITMRKQLKGQIIYTTSGRLISANRQKHTIKYFI